MLKTKFTELMGVEYPLMQGGMHFVGYADLAAAVSEAGGLGTITALTQPDPESLRKEIRKAKSLTKKPIAVNLTLLPMLAPPNYEEFAQVVLDEGIRIIETAGRNPEKWIKFFKKAGCVVIHKCVAVKHAISAQKMGADMISMDGYECGGHPGENDVTNWVLFARAAKQLKIPYIASGACADGRQLAAALALGCEGMNMGTRWMATKEAPIKQGIKDAIVKASEYDTTLVFTTLANTERVFKNACAEEVREREKKDPGNFGAIADLVKGAKYRISFQETGNPDDSVWSCGQSIGLIEDVPSCKDLVKNICEEAVRVIQNNATQNIVSKL
ncbi:unnamed protein product [Amoebophrya sp. A25]|nr:unnamed protein product [Amoebophrya sp. A25]|eukprot:GSA25T00005310001.1